MKNKKTTKSKPCWMNIPYKEEEEEQKKQPWENERSSGAARINKYWENFITCNADANICTWSGDSIKIATRLFQYIAQQNFFKELFYRINGQKRRMEFSYFAIEPLRQWPSGEHKRSDYHGCYLVKHNGVKCIL